jgi:hypothetical protein
MSSKNIQNFPSEKNFLLKNLLFLACRRHVGGTGTREPTRRRLHQRPAAALAHSLEDRGARGRRRSSVPDFTTTSSLARLRIKNPQSLSGKRK